ncbi:MAG: transcriptional repressor LexA [bacterium]|nr:transcriptional repressor LexA [bacterium]
MMKSFDKLSERQRNILRFIDRYITDHGFPPTIRDIGEATKIASTSVVYYNLNKLVQAGFLERSAATSRGLRLVKPLPNSRRRVAKAVEALRVPMYGLIVASAPVETSNEAQEDIEVPEYILGNVDPAEVFALTVRGDSMIDAMVQDGDTIFLRHADSVRNGEMAAIWLPERNETTLKYFFNEGERIRLQPAHPTMDPIYVNPSNCQVQGRVLGVVRAMR